MDVSIALDIKFTPVGFPINVSESQEKFQESSDFLAPKKSAFFFKSETQVKSPLRKFKENSLDLAINKLIYGCRVSKLNKYSLYHLMIFYINEENNRYLHWIPLKKSGAPSRLDLLKIKLIHDTSNNEISHHSCKINKLLYILYSNDKTKKFKLTLKFPDSLSKEMFWQGLLHFMSQASTMCQFRTHHEMLASTFLKKEQGKNMDLKSLRIFLKNRHIFVEIDELKVVFSKLSIDVNSSFVLTKILLRQILRDLLNDNGFLEIFSNYCESWLDDKNEKTEHYMSISELKKFFSIEQGEEFDEETLREIIKTYDDKKMETNYSTDFISLSGFRNILCSLNNEFFNPNKLIVYQNMNRPLTDYFIKSSHNTYLSSNQLIGNSSVEAYIHALSHGYRCIELDCWDGEKGEPVIYHGYTLTSKISFNEVMRSIVDFGFIKNPYPIILSIENHCNKNQQKLMAKIIKETCGDLLYYLPENHHELEFLPSPEDLRRKILIKTKIPILKKTKNTEPGSAAASTMNSRMSVFFRSTKPENKTNTSSFTKTVDMSPNLMFNRAVNKDSKLKGNTLGTTIENCLDETIVQQTEDNSLEYTEQKNKNIDLASEIGILGQNISFTKVKSISLLKSLVAHQKTHSLKHDFITISEKNEEDQNSGNSPHENLSNNFTNSPVNQEDQKCQSLFQMKTHSDNIITTKSPKIKIDTMSSKFKENHTYRTNHTHHLSIQMSIEKGDKFEKPSFHFNFEVDFNKIHVQFLKNVSLLGVKMSFIDPIRSVFSISSLNEARISKYLAENESKIINFHRKYLSRTYPSGTRIDSSNYDPIPSFLAGAQLVALNIQTCDLFLLVYEALFRENGGLNCGYVLKPKFMRKNEKTVLSELSKVKKIVRMNIISVQGISSLLKNSNSGHYVEISLRGSKLDETENKVYRSETIKKKGGNGKFCLKTEFSARCPKLCFILIQLYGKNDLMSDERLGWCCVNFKNIRKGYRRIPLFDNKINEIDSCFLFGHMELEKTKK